MIVKCYKLFCVLYTNAVFVAYMGNISAIKFLLHLWEECVIMLIRTKRSFVTNNLEQKGSIGMLHRRRE